MRYFKSNGKKQCILTAAFRVDVIELLNQYALPDFITVIEGLDNYHAASKVERGKALFNDNNVKPETCIMFGNTIHDFEVAEAMGIDCKLKAYGHQSKAR